MDKKSENTSINKHYLSKILKKCLRNIIIIIFGPKIRILVLIILTHLSLFGLFLNSTHGLLEFPLLLWLVGLSASFWLAPPSLGPTVADGGELSELDLGTADATLFANLAKLNVHGRPAS